MSFAPDYVDVAERTREFFARFPEGSIVCEPPTVVIIADRPFVSVTARCYRTPDDPTPSQGSSWEPFPGKTNYTRDSEAMNCETSAVGRAIVWAGIPAKRIATEQDVKARQDPPRKSASDQAVIDAKNRLVEACGGNTEKAAALWGDRETITPADLAELLASV